MGRAVVYASSAESGEVRVFTLATRDGALALLQTVPIGGMAMPMALDADRRMLYVARRSAPFAILAFAIDAGSGRLALRGEARVPAGMTYIATDESGRFLLGASYSHHIVAVSPLGADGVPRAAQQVITTPPNAHCIRPAPGNRHVYATSLGGDMLLHWHFDAGTGELRAAERHHVPMQAGAGPRHFAFHPRRPVIYVLGEHDGSVSLFDIDAQHGALSHRQTLSALPADFTGTPWAADLHLVPDGRFLYVSERRSSLLAILRVDPVDGTLTLLGHQAAQAQPRGFAIDPAGRFLITAGQMSHQLGVHAIDPQSGGLTPCAQTEAGRGPNWVEILALPPAETTGDLP